MPGTGMMNSAKHLLQKKTEINLGLSVRIITEKSMNTVRQKMGILGLAEYFPRESILPAWEVEHTP